MIETPIGKIKISINDKEVEYVANQYICDMPLIKQNPIAGCYRIKVAYNQNDTIKCELVFNTSVERYNSGGESYACKIFEKTKFN